MLLRAECIPCALNMAISAIRRLGADDNAAQLFTTRILKFPALKGLDWTKTAPEVAEFIIREIVNLMDNPDPFQEMKAEQNRNAMQIYPWLKELATSASDPLYTSVNLSIIGNSLDAMKYEKSMDLKSLIQERMKIGIPKPNFDEFCRKLSKSNLIVYCGDNSGEIIFDKVLIEIMKAKYNNLEIVYVVRSIPALNDVTLEEVSFTGMDKIVSVMENGIDAPFPGTVLERCSSKIKRLFEDADLIISKGGGNFDSLDEEKSLGNVSFMLLAKCLPYSQKFGAILNTPVLENRYLY